MILKEEITPENLINYLNNQEDIREKKFSNNEFLNNKKKEYNFTDEIKDLNKKIEELLSIVESADFKNLNLENKDEKKLHDEILDELQNYKDKIEILLNAEKNYLEMKEKHKTKIEKLKYENYKNIFKENFKLYEKFKKENKDISSIPEFFKPLFIAYEGIDFEKTEEEQIKDFIKIYEK